MSLSSKIIGFLALLVIFVGQLEAALDAGQLVGKFKYDSDPKDPQMDAFLTAAGFDEKQRAVIQGAAPSCVKEIIVNGDELTYILDIGIKKSQHKMKSGQEFTETPIVGNPVQTFPTIEKDKLTLVRKVNGADVTEVLTCDVSECIATYSTKDVTAQAKWKRM